MSSYTDPEPSSSAAIEAYNQHADKLLGGSAILIVTIATVVYHFLEDWSWVDSLYFSVIAVTTVGFGDLTPSTDASKLFTIGYIVTGIGIIGLYLNHRIERVRRRRARKASGEAGE